MNLHKVSMRKTVTDGAPYYDKAVYAKPKRLSLIGTSIRQAMKIRGPQPLLIGYELVRLNWMKPDGKGGLVPRGK